jgi:exodeoxyribonuclease VII small subunit
MSDATITKAASPAKQPDIAGLSFEEALAELERIVRGLEGGQQRLEEAISAYERGSRLRQHCEAEMRVERIVAGQETAAAPPANMTAELDEEIPF